MGVIVNSDPQAKTGLELSVGILQKRMGTAISGDDEQKEPLDTYNSAGAL